MSGARLSVFARAGGVVAASALMTFLFASAVAAVTQGSSRQREAVSNAEQVVAIDAAAGREVKLSDTRKLVLVSTGTADQLSLGNGPLVQLPGDEEAVVVSRLGGTATALHQQISARAAAFAAVAETPNDQARLAAQDYAAIWRRRGVRGAVMPEGFGGLDADWRCSVVEGLSLGGVATIHQIERASQRSASGCDKAVRGEALLTTSLDAAEGDSQRRVIFAGDAGSAGSAVLDGAMVGAVPLELVGAQQDALAKRAQTDDKVNKQLVAAALTLSAWIGTLPAKGNQPSRIPPPKRKKKRSSSSSRRDGGMVESGPESGGLVKKPRSQPQPPAPAPTPSPAPEPNNGNGTGGSQRPDCRSGDC